MTLDANILIAYLGGEVEVIKILDSWKKTGKPLLLPTVAETEVLSFVGWAHTERQIAEEFISQNFTSIPFDRTISRIAAKIRRETKLKFPDAAIAATAIFTKTPIVTRNIRDFQKIQEIKIIEI